jgi:hypothetical protein
MTNTAKEQPRAGGGEPAVGRTPLYADDLVSLYRGDCLDALREMPDASVDAVVTDPPYG